MEIVVVGVAEEDVVRAVKEAVEALASPIDVVVVGAEETKLETEDVLLLKVSLPLDVYRVMREAALAKALSDPQLGEVWAVPPEVEPDELAYELSLALLRRLLDALVAERRPDLVVERARPEVVEGDTVAYTLVRTLAVDGSFSLAVAGRTSDALRLLESLSQHPIYGLYRQFWEFAAANFRFLPIYNWLILAASPQGPPR
ncbi:hypothetical protein [Pyrobaculum neutrophilum]|uniref:Uncharacterized protein n=1 Tax=Pyrobaculum neutrophilum (strain DSM 2338 / JCM 9278 / NBRC 100436 / V24Sta) TaxID=444157 RepID=B1YC15_PYRNV|nr:hypothetical protein [Pyrobaculum neutrophilum]ACB40869.1 conserved hypothetical protein [Pyrobaculum neutrophilum V24Sta]